MLASSATASPSPTIAAAARAIACLARTSSRKRKSNPSSAWLLWSGRTPPRTRATSPCRASSDRSLRMVTSETENASESSATWTASLVSSICSTRCIRSTWERGGSAADMVVPGRFRGSSIRWRRAYDPPGRMSIASFQHSFLLIRKLQGCVRHSISPWVDDRAHARAVRNWSEPTTSANPAARFRPEASRVHRDALEERRRVRILGHPAGRRPGGDGDVSPGDRGAGALLELDRARSRDHLRLRRPLLPSASQPWPACSGTTGEASTARIASPVSASKKWRRSTSTASVT